MAPVHKAAVLLCLLCVACATGEWVRPYDKLAGVETAAFVVRDGRTGEPIEGATVRGHIEWDLTDDGEWAPLEHEGVTDEFGIAAFDVGKPPGSYHWVIEAEGFAPTEEYGGIIFREVDLVPGRNHRARILGPLGEPVRDMRVEYKLGCAHAPALRVARTDAEGYFVLRNIHGQGDLCFDAPGCRADYWHAPLCDMGQLPVHHMDPGFRVEGKLLDRNGEPFQWAVVQSDTSARGPRTMCGPDGRFVLEGANQRAALWVFAGDYFGEKVELHQYRPGGPLVIRMGAGEPASTREVEELVAYHRGERVDCEIHLDRVADGRRYTDPTKIPAGDYVVSAGEPFSQYFARPRPWGGETRVEVGERPRLKVVRADESGLPAHLIVHGYGKVAIPGADEPPLHLPASARAAVRVYSKYRSWHFPVGPVRNGEREVAITMPEPTRVVLPEIEGDFQVLPESWKERDGGYVTWLTGSVKLFIAHETKGWAEYAFVAEPGKTVRLPVPEFESGSVVTVLDPDGKPSDAASVTFTMRDPHRAGAYTVDGYTELAAEGATVRISDRGRGDDRPYVSFVARLKGPGPHTVSFGSCGIDIPENERIYIDGEILIRTKLRGLQPGWHILIVQPEDKPGYAMRLELQPGEIRRIEEDE